MCPIEIIWPSARVALVSDVANRGTHPRVRVPVRPQRNLTRGIGGWNGLHAGAAVVTSLQVLLLGTDNARVSSSSLLLRTRRTFG